MLSNKSVCYDHVAQLTQGFCDVRGKSRGLVVYINQLRLHGLVSRNQAPDFRRRESGYARLNVAHWSSSSFQTKASSSLEAVQSASLEVSL